MMPSSGMAAFVGEKWLVVGEGIAVLSGGHCPCQGTETLSLPLRFNQSPIFWAPSAQGRPGYLWLIVSGYNRWDQSVLLLCAGSQDPLVGPKSLCLLNKGLGIVGRAERSVLTSYLGSLLAV